MTICTYTYIDIDTDTYIYRDTNIMWKMSFLVTVYS